MPSDSRSAWKLIFNTKINGNSWNSFVEKIENQGKLLILISPEIKSTDNKVDKHPEISIVYGAYIEDSIVKSPNWNGSSKNFLFSFSHSSNSLKRINSDPKSSLANTNYVESNDPRDELISLNRDIAQNNLKVFNSAMINNNYQYFNYQTKTLPNGLGLGGQLEYFGLWIDSDFIHGHSFPSATYANSNLSAIDFLADSESLSSTKSAKGPNEFLIKSVSVFECSDISVKMTGKKGTKSAVSKNPDAVAILEMANRTIYSKDFIENVS
ncbi:TLD domain-containing protein 1 [Smittium culicis]|uniref:Oxidation resistance protein 1 n=1 Tax=Smittium culicis TaxID=133412 RepID=A0A1R1Y8H9_9FUNG|nr:TLD domain-containing protein 1 [Smittium culicis]